MINELAKLNILNLHKIKFCMGIIKTNNQVPYVT